MLSNDHFAKPKDNVVIKHILEAFKKKTLLILILFFIKYFKIFYLTVINNFYFLRLC